IARATDSLHATPRRWHTERNDDSDSPDGLETLRTAAAGMARCRGCRDGARRRRVCDQQACRAATAAATRQHAGQGTAGDSAAARRDPPRARRRLLPARADGHRAAGARDRALVRSFQPEDLRHLRPRLRNARRGAEGARQFPARVVDCADRFGDPRELGRVPLRDRAPQGIDPRVRARARRSAVQEARDRAHQSRQVHGGAGRHCEGRGLPAPRDDGFARQSGRGVQPRAPRLPRRTLRRGARLDAAGGARGFASARSTAPRHVHRAQARRHRCCAVVPVAARQPLSAFRRGGQHRLRGLPVTGATEGGAGAGTAASASRASAGAKLKAAREAQTLTIEAVAQQLKLAPRQVKALENDDYGHLPGRTFVRGFARNYARFVHLDPDAVVALLPNADAAPALERPGFGPVRRPMGELPMDRAPRRSPLRWSFPLVLVVIVGVAAYYEYLRQHGMLHPIAERVAAVTTGATAGGSTPTGSS